MASVVFIIRVPYEENSESSKTEGESEHTSLEGNKEEDISEQLDQDDEKGKESVTKVDNDRSENETGQAVDQNKSEQTSQGNETAQDVETLTHLDLAKVLENELRSLKVQGDSWTVTNDRQFHQVVFLEKTGEAVEKILERLTIVGIGKRIKSSVSIIPTSVHIEPKETENVAGKKFSMCESNQCSDAETEPLLLEKKSTKEQFKKSIKSRLTVEQVVQSVRTQAILTFDFVMFTILASVIAAVGLVEDNAVVLVASMLVSPLMGPILGGTFGTVIKNNNLRNTGLKTELCGLILSVVVGFLFGLISGPFGASWDSTKGLWPTKEMTSRGMTRGLWVGILIALPSGAGVALSVLGGNAGSLVGVAISASLLPPAVNSGMLWAYSMVASPELTDIAKFSPSKFQLNCTPFKDNSYEPMYNCDMRKEAAIMAVISLVLTIVNIICIFITATIVLKIKEVTPKASSSNATQTFWMKDVKVAREAYQTFRGDQATKFLEEWKKVNQKDSIEQDGELLNIIEEVEKNEEFESVVRRAPRGAQNLHKCSRVIKRLTSKDGDENTAHKQATNLQNQLRNLQTYYTVNTQHSRDQGHQRHVETIFSVQEVEPKLDPAHVETTLNEPENKPTRKSVREFVVVDPEKPHHKSVVRVQAPTDHSERYSITTESGV